MYINTKCPDCKTEQLHLMATDNQWKYKCLKCRNRFNEQLEKMPDVETITRSDLFPS